MKWIVREQGAGYEAEHTIEADNATDAAHEYVEDYGADDRQDVTHWVDIECWTGDGEEVTVDSVPVDPVEPDCVDDDDEHDWRAPHSLLGGCEESPGVVAHGGGVICNEVCVRCGCLRVTDTWAQRPDTGKQGLRSVGYKPGEYTNRLGELTD